MGAAGSATPAMLSLTARGQLAVQLLRCSRQPPAAWARKLWGRGVLPRRRSAPTECLWGTATPCGPGLATGGTGSPARAAVGAYRVPAGDASPLLPGPTSLGDGESCPGGGGCLPSACGGRQPPSARAHQLGGRGVVTRQQLVHTECLRGTSAPCDRGPPAEGTGSPAQAAVGAHGGPAGDGGSQRPGPTSWGDAESYPCGGWCS